MKNVFEKTLKTIAVLSAMLILSSHSVFASADADASANKVDGIVTVYATLNDDFYVEAGKFVREYRQQVIKQLSDKNILNKEFTETLDMIGVETEALALNYTDSVIKFSQDMAE